jgi:GTP cyclohydrolase II
VSGVDLVTNNPHKLATLHKAGITVHRRVALSSPANAHNIGYLETKRARTGHLIEIRGEEPQAKAS